MADARAGPRLHGEHAAAPNGEHAARSMAMAAFSEYYTLSFDARKATNMASIAVFSSLGVLLRYGCGVLFTDYLQATVYSAKREPSGILFHDLMVNVIGSYLMGNIASFREELQGYSPALYVGLTTGLCGCATTFSAWTSSMVVLAWDFDNGCALYPFSALLGTAIGFVCAYTARSFGEHSATCMRHAYMRLRYGVSSSQLLVARERSDAHKPAPLGAGPPQVSTHESMTDFRSARGDPAECEDDALELDRGIVRYLYEWGWTSECWEVARLLVVLCVWLGLTAVYVTLYTFATHQRTRVLLLACVIAPLGAWMRYIVSFGNKNVPNFPLYTYLCNLVASVLSILIYVALTKVLPASAGSMSVAAEYRLTEWLLAISLGFCGCLSTVSSFVNEVAQLWQKATLYDSYFYTIATLLSIHVICLAFLLPFSVHYSDCEAGPGVVS
ncbi:CrcB-like protein-domain-containing protein [Pavlovales sp. CCMP2436]|nr:CrcB-like protein-domain-containing protein [Pavlovales sp. CCMP2436]